MPGNTTRDKYRFPVGADAPNVPQDIQNLAQDVEDMRALVLSRNVLDVGQLNQTRMGRQLLPADFTMLGLNQPVGLFGMGSLVNQGSGGNLVNKGAVPFTTGVSGAASEAALFAGATGQAFYLADTGAADPFRIKTGSVFCWASSGGRGSAQYMVSKSGSTSGTRSYALYVDSNNRLGISLSFDGINVVGFSAGDVDILDNKLHFVGFTFDGITCKLWCDGVMVASVAYAPGVPTPGMWPSPTAFNIGNGGADGATNGVLPHYGKIDEVIVTPDVLSADEIRFLMCVKVAHGFVPGALARTAKWVRGMSVRRKQKGAPLAQTDFPVNPVRLHNHVAGSLADSGTNNVPLVANPGTGAIFSVPGPDGLKDSAYLFAHAHNGLSATDTGLPAGTSARSYGLWMNTQSIIGAGIMGWGTISANDTRLILAAGSGALQLANGASSLLIPGSIADGAWHKVDVVEDNAATDGMKRKVYVDGILAGAFGTIGSVTLAGANRFRVGANPDGTAPFFGMTSREYVVAIALTPEQIAAIYQKQVRDMGISPKNPGDHVERVDDTNIYVLCDTLDASSSIDLEVAA